MNIQHSTLDSGLRLLTIQVPGATTVTVEVGVRAGTRFEAPEVNGIAHFLEHMFFKGGKKYINTQAVAEAIDSIGGNFNAFTGKEYVGYYVKTAQQDMQIGLDVLSDMLCHASLPAAEIEKERGVILEEINMYEDNPQAKVAHQFDHLFYGNHPLGWETLGPKEIVSRLHRTDFVNYMNAHYTAGNMLVTIAGDIKHADMETQVARYFAGLPKGKQSNFQPFKRKPSDRIHYTMKPIEQSHFILGMPAFGFHHPDQYASRLLSIILGGNMSSRLFLRIREEKSLCYYVYSSRDVYADTGCFYIAAGVDTERTQEAIHEVQIILAEMARHGITNEELKKAQSYVIGKMMINLESTGAIADFFAEDSLLYDDRQSITDLKDHYLSITLEDVNRVAASLFVPENYHLALVGPEAVSDVHL